MSLQSLSGGAILPTLFLALSVFIVAGLGFVTLFAIVYHRYIFPRRYLPSYDSSYAPRCSIILPCKGTPQDFESNIRSFTELDYDDYEIIFCVESTDDPAVPVINKLVETDSRASLVVAGITTTCSQKNHNMIAAIEKANNPDVYVFADSDIKPAKTWLNELIRPLARDDITVVSGFRWLYSSTGKLGELANAYQNGMLFILFTFASFVNDVGLWGGSMAIKKKEFDELGVKDFWKQAVVDDNSLSRLIMKNSKKSVMVSTCITPTDDALKTIRQSINWFERQVMFLKAYQRPIWYAAILLVTTCLALQLLLPVSLLVSYYTDTTFLEAGGAATLFFFFGTLLMTLLWPFLGRQPTFFRFLFFQPVSLYSVLYGAFKTLFTNTVKWSGFHYKLNYSGKVISVEQLP